MSKASDSGSKWRVDESRWVWLTLSPGRSWLTPLLDTSTQLRGRNQSTVKYLQCLFEDKHKETCACTKSDAAVLVVRSCLLVFLMKTESCFPRDKLHLFMIICQLKFYTPLIIPGQHTGPCGASKKLYIWYFVFSAVVAITYILPLHLWSEEKRAWKTFRMVNSVFYQYSSSMLRCGAQRCWILYLFPRHPGTEVLLGWEK